MYITVIYRQPCALHNLGTPYTTPKGVVHCAWSGGIQLFSGDEYSSPTGWLHKPLASCLVDCRELQPGDMAASVVGTFPYMSPEIASGRAHNSKVSLMPLLSGSSTGGVM